MRQAIDFIKPDEIIEGTYKMGNKKFPLGLQPDNSVCFKRTGDKNVYRGFMLCGGYAVSIIRGAK